MQTLIHKNDIPTPAALIDSEIVNANIARAQEYFSRHNIAFRPHIKTHKLPRFANAQIEAGACGINAQKISEAKVFADAGFEDILITYNILGTEKCERLRELHDQIATLIVTADSAETISGLAPYFDETKPLNVMVECDTGGGRVGVQTPESALALAKFISETPSLRFHGLMTYPAKNSSQNVERFMRAAKAQIESAGIACDVISSGGTPDIWRAHEAPVTTEYRAGTYIYNDRSLVELGHEHLENCAFRVLATVVSTPTKTRAVIDAGSKTLSSDLIGLKDYGLVINMPNLRIVGLSEEHGVIEGEHGFRVGDRIEILPNHVCVVSNLLDAIWISEENGYRAHRVDARGTVV